jgi:AsmA family
MSRDFVRPAQNTEAASPPPETKGPPETKFPQAGNRKMGSRLALLAIVLALIAAVALPPVIRLNRFRGILEESMTRSLGRQVRVQGVYLRLLPRPGFQLAGFTVQDDPAFGSEPMLRSDSVAASLRLTSLWRGRMEIASLSLSAPSLNLVRSADGRWNAEAILGRAAQIPSAPTALRRAESRPRFPYIEAEGGRINFKFGEEKKVFFLRDADFSLWLASEDQWSMRLSARPVRSDANLGDTGQLTINGSFQRSPDLRTTPLKLDAVWENAQLGQLTHLAYGRDRGWRGGITAHAIVSGSPSALSFTADARAAGFRRYDIAQPDSVTLAVNCEGLFRGIAQTSVNAAPHVLYLQCEAPVGSGGVVLRGQARTSANYDFDVIVDKLPLASLAALARHLKRDLPPNLKAGGTLSGSLEFLPSEATGSLVASDFSLRSASGASSVLANAVIFALGESGTRKSATLDSATRESETRLVQTKPARFPYTSAAPSPIVLRMLPVSLLLGGASPLIVSGHAGGADYAVEMKGEADCERLLNLLETLALPPPPRLGLIRHGKIKVDLRTAGSWQGFASPVTSGSLRLLPSATGGDGITGAGGPAINGARE